MGLSGEISLSTDGDVLTGQLVTALCPVLNDGDAAAVLMQFVPHVSVDGTTPTSVPVAIGAPFPRLPLTIPAGQSVTVGFSFTPQAPVGTFGLASPAVISYSVGALLYGSDGTVTQANPGSFDTESSIGAGPVD